MVFKLMSVAELKALYQKIQKPIFVKFPKNDKQVFLFKGHSFRDNDRRIYVYNDHKIVETTAPEFLVAMTFQTYELRQIRNQEDYRLALRLFHQLVWSEIPTDEEYNFRYLLGLTLEDYESFRNTSKYRTLVEFIEQLLDQDGKTWEDVRTALGYHRSISIHFLKITLTVGNVRGQDLTKLSHFFQLPIQCFISGAFHA